MARFLGDVGEDSFMAALQALVEHLFEPPGQPPAHPALLLDGAAACHRRLLLRAAGQPRSGSGDALTALLAALAEDPNPDRTGRILNHPLLVDALHSMNDDDPELRAWEETTVSSEPGDPAAGSAGHGREKLNHLAWAFLLRRSPAWGGSVDLCTDAFGFLRFPFCDWSLWLRATVDGHDEVLANAVVALALSSDRATWSLAANPSAPFLVMTRRDCCRMMVANDSHLSRSALSFPNRAIHPRLLYATRLGDSPLRYEPVGFDDDTFTAHAGLTGAIVESLLTATLQNAPAIHGEIGRYLTVIRGYELPATIGQTLASFSTPNLPGVMNINILYSEDDQPLLDPFCFTWLGHELGHTKHYLIDDAAHQAGWRFVHNPGDRTGPIPRYRRSLAVRTLFQIPYVHLYELAMLTAFRAHHFAGLPWDVVDDPVAVGDDVVAEIRESFDLIAEWADLTELGRVAVTHFHGMFDAAVGQWNGLPG